MHGLDANGANIPAIGFGTWTLEGEQAARLVSSALQSGYRHIDTASFYNNEEAVGEAVRTCGLPRDSIFLTTKIWGTDLADGDLQRSVEGSLKRLQVDTVDLALIHFPPKTVPMSESVRALNEVVDRGLARHIGVSNFTVRHIEEAVAASRHPLACNQIEYHPLLNQNRVLRACRDHGMAVVSFCPLSRAGELFSEEPILRLAEKNGKTPAQIVLRWHIQQQDVAAIPRSTSADHVRENLDVFDFSLDDEDMTAINALRSRGFRICDFDLSPEWDEV